MSPHILGCAILADRHLDLAEGVRGLLETSFSTVYLVASIDSLLEGARQLNPALVALDLSMAEGNIERVTKNIRKLAPDCRVLILSVYDQAAASRVSLSAGANGIVLKRTIGSDFLPAVAAVMRGETFVSPDFELPGEPLVDSAKPEALTTPENLPQ